MFGCCCDAEPEQAAEVVVDPGRWEVGPTVSEEELKKHWPKKPETFEVEVAYKQGKLGLDISHFQGKYLKIKGVKEGSVSKHNKANPDTALEKDQIIMAVNGVEGDSTKMLAAASTSTPRANKMKFLVSRGMPFADPFLCRLCCKYSGGVPGATYYLTYGDNVATHTYEEDWDSQKWWIHDSGDGFFRVQNKMNSKWMNYDWAQKKPVLTELNKDWPSMKWATVEWAGGGGRPWFRLENADKHPFENEQNGFGPDGKPVNYRRWYLNEGNTGNGTSNRTVGLISNYEVTNPPQWTWTSAQWTFEKI